MNSFITRAAERLQSWLLAPSESKLLHRIGWSSILKSDATWKRGRPPDPSAPWEPRRLPNLAPGRPPGRGAGDRLGGPAAAQRALARGLGGGEPSQGARKSDERARSPAEGPGGSARWIASYFRMLLHNLRMLHPKNPDL